MSSLISSSSSSSCSNSLRSSDSSSTYILSTPQELVSLWNNYQYAIEQYMDKRLSVTPSDKRILLYNIQYTLYILLSTMPLSPLQIPILRYELINYITNITTTTNNNNSQRDLHDTFLIPIIHALPLSSTPILYHTLLMKYMDNNSTNTTKNDTNTMTTTTDCSTTKQNELELLPPLSIPKEITNIIVQITSDIDNYSTEYDNNILIIFHTLLLLLHNSEPSTSSSSSIYGLYMAVILLFRKSTYLSLLPNANNTINNNIQPWYLLSNSSTIIQFWLYIFSILIPLYLRYTPKTNSITISSNTIFLDSRHIIIQDILNIMYNNYLFNYFSSPTSSTNTTKISQLTCTVPIVYSTSSTKSITNISSSSSNILSDTEIFNLFIDRIAIIISGCIVYLSSPEDMYSLAKILQQQNIIFRTYIINNINIQEKCCYLFNTLGMIIEEISNSLYCHEDYLPSSRTLPFRNIINQKNNSSSILINQLLISIQQYILYMENNSPSSINHTSIHKHILSLLNMFQMRPSSYLQNLFLLDSTATSNSSIHTNNIISTSTKRNIMDTQSNIPSKDILVPIKQRKSEPLSSSSTTQKSSKKSRKTSSKYSFESIELLPDVLNLIFQYIDNPITLGIISRVSHNWLECSRNSLLWLPHFYTRWKIIDNYNTTSTTISSSNTTTSTTSTSSSIEDLIPTNNTNTNSKNNSYLSKEILQQIINSPIPLKSPYLRCLCTIPSFVVAKTNLSSNISSVISTTNTLSPKYCTVHNYYIMFRSRILAEQQAIYLSHQKYLHQNQKIHTLTSSPNRKNTRILTEKLINQLEQHLTMRSLVLPPKDTNNNTTALINNSRNELSTHTILGSDLYLKLLPKYTYRVCDICTCSKILESIEESKQHLMLHHCLHTNNNTNTKKKIKK